jgi:hypothetical protein
VFSTAESARIIRFLLQGLEDHFFYDCPGFAVLAGDFKKGLSKGMQKRQPKSSAEEGNTKREANSTGNLTR